MQRLIRQHKMMLEELAPSYKWQQKKNVGLDALKNYTLAMRHMEVEGYRLQTKLTISTT